MNSRFFWGERILIALSWGKCPKLEPDGHPFVNCCFHWMFSNLYVGTGCLTKHLFKNWLFGIPGRYQKGPSKTFQTVPRNCDACPKIVPTICSTSQNNWTWWSFIITWCSFMITWWSFINLFFKMFILGGHEPCKNQYFLKIASSLVVWSISDLLGFFFGMVFLRWGNHEQPYPGKIWDLRNLTGVYTWCNHFSANLSTKLCSVFVMRSLLLFLIVKFQQVLRKTWCLGKL